MSKSPREPFRPQYLQKGRASRGLRPIGEVFAMKFKGIGCLFGRVIRNDCPWEWSGAPSVMT